MLFFSLALTLANSTPPSPSGTSTCQRVRKFCSMSRTPGLIMKRGVKPYVALADYSHPLTSSLVDRRSQRRRIMLISIRALILQHDHPFHDLKHCLKHGLKHQRYVRSPSIGLDDLDEYVCRSNDTPPSSPSGDIVPVGAANAGNNPSYSGASSTRPGTSTVLVALFAATISLAL